MAERAGNAIAILPVGARVLVLCRPRKEQAEHGATVWWVVRVLTGTQRDRVGWMRR